MELEIRWALPLLFMACAEEPLTTIDARCGYGETTFEIATYLADRDVLVVIDREQARMAEPRLRGLVAALLTGALDGDPARVLRHDESLRLAIASPPEVADSVRTGTQLPFLRYHWAPYGYADDAERFLDRVPCLYGPAPTACADAAEGRPLDVSLADVILIRDERSDPGAIELIAATAHDAHLATVAADAPDYRPALLQLEDCSRTYPYGSESAPLDTADFQIEDDGRLSCRLFETLPASGPITRCAQLADYGRRFEAIAADGAHEVCEVEQVRHEDAETHHGWLIPTEHQFRSSWPEGEPMLGCAEYHAMFEGVPAFTWISAPIPGARMLMRCALAASAERPSCEEL